jgi:hypothetical protein
MFERETAAITALVALGSGVAGCMPQLTYGQCPDPPPAGLSQEPTKLSATGLFADMRAGTLASDVVPYRPQFELWSDGAEKRRWVYLPPGSRIDAHDIDAWQFPVGTKFWKEFTRDGVRVETRLLHKVGPAPSEWVALSYVWDADNANATATPDGLDDARGTPHDVPSARDCMGCHGGTQSHVLGFAAIQLAHDGPEGAMTLERLVRDRRLDGVPPAMPALTVPGDALTRQALGYLHANCSHCHNQHRPRSTGPRCFDPHKDFDFSLRVHQLASPESTPVYQTAFGKVVTPGDPEGSTVLERFQSHLFFQPRMPALGTEEINPEAVRLLSAWIRQIPVRDARR